MAVIYRRIRLDDWTTQKHLLTHYERKLNIKILSIDNIIYQFYTST